jgi:hypothetical protein
MKLSLSEYTGIKIVCNNHLTKDNWDRLSLSLDRATRNEILKAIKKYDSCIISVKSCVSRDTHDLKYYKQHPEYSGYSISFDMSFNTKWTKEEAKINNYVGATGIGTTFLIPLSMWFTVYRLKNKNINN